MCCEIEEMAIQIARQQYRAGGKNSPLVRALCRLIERQEGGLAALLLRLQTQGLARQAASWTGSGPNQPLCPTRIRDVLGETFYRRLQRRLDLDDDEAEHILAAALPAAIDRLTPNGQVESRPLQRGTGHACFSRLLAACRRPLQLC